MHRLPDRLRSYPLGWRAKLGLLIPALETGYGSYEFDVMSPDGVVPLEHRVPGRAVTVDELSLMVAGALDAAQTIANADPDVIDFIATAPCFVMGGERESELIDAITAATGIPATAGGRAVSASLRALGARRILTYTPYLPPIEHAMQAYFAASGIEVLDGIALEFARLDDINRVPPLQILADIERLARRNPDADGVFVVGGCFRTLDIVDRLESLIGIPVVGTQQANMFTCLGMCGIDEEFEGFGRLLALPRRSHVARP